MTSYLRGRLEKQGGIYKIVNNKNGRFYIGSTKCFHNRIRDHKSALRSSIHRNQFLQHDYNKCGMESFVYEILEVIESDDQKVRILREKEYIDIYYDNQIMCYNISPDPQNIEMSKETREKISLSKKKLCENEEYRKKLGSVNIGRTPWNKGKKATEEAKKNQSISHIGIPGYRTGIYGVATGCAKIYEVKVIDPDGNIYGPIVCLADFVREHNLGYNNFRALIIGKQKSSKGWKLLSEPINNGNRITIGGEIDIF